MLAVGLATFSFIWILFLFIQEARGLFVAPEVADPDGIEVRMFGFLLLNERC